MQTRQLLGEILVRLRVLSRSDVDRVLDAMRRCPRPQKFGQVARAMNLLTEEHILAALAVQADLLPGIGQLGLQQILARLQAADTA
jgi:hypothetical protein